MSVLIRDLGLRIAATGEEALQEYFLGQEQDAPDLAPGKVAIWPYYMMTGVFRARDGRASLSVVRSRRHQTS